MWKQGAHRAHPDWLVIHHRASPQFVLHRLESGSVDGSLGDVAYVPFLLMLVLFGLMLALVGFWRVGSSFSTQLSAQAGSVAPDEGSGMLANLWMAWTGTEAPAHSFSVDSQTRSVSASINGSSAFNLGNFGAWQWSISSGEGIQVRSERFYPGQPVCVGAQCNE
jgi:hypothetical protein